MHVMYGTPVRTLTADKARVKITGKCTPADMVASMFGFIRMSGPTWSSCAASESLNTEMIVYPLGLARVMHDRAQLVQIDFSIVGMRSSFPSKSPRIDLFSMTVPVYRFCVKFSGCVYWRIEWAELEI
jgi:hypothetical protein